MGRGIAAPVDSVGLAAKHARGLTGGSAERDGGAWQWNYMFQLGLIIGGGTAQIQKNIIAERGLEMPREPKPAKISDAGQETAGLARQKQGAD